MPWRERGRCRGRRVKAGMRGLMWIFSDRLKSPPPLSLPLLGAASPGAVQGGGGVADDLQSRKRRADRGSPDRSQTPQRQLHPAGGVNKEAPGSEICCWGRADSPSLSVSWDYGNKRWRWWERRRLATPETHGLPGSF